MILTACLVAAAVVGLVWFAAAIYCVLPHRDFEEE
jgi:hypothetical protein